METEEQWPVAPPVNDYEGDQWWEDWAERVKEEGDSE